MIRALSVAAVVTVLLVAAAVERVAKETILVLSTRIFSRTFGVTTGVASVDCAKATFFIIAFGVFSGSVSLVQRQPISLSLSL